jgi:tetratricopeptide (TPR) repeat protein
MMPPELCFVLMPFGRKQDAAGKWIEFDAVYRDLIAPAIADACLEAVRADQEELGGIIHKPMFERIVLCRYAVADLTAANANVAYELGVRHGIRPYSTVLLFAEGSRLPFDLQDLRCIPYSLDENGRPANVEMVRNKIAEALRAAQAANTDSPVYQLVDGLPAPDLAHVKTDVFRSSVSYNNDQKERLAQARKRKDGAVEELNKVESQLGDIAAAEAGVVIDLFLSYRAVKAWKEMIRLQRLMSRPLQGSVMVQEQLALALNRDGQAEQAEHVLLQLIEQRGPSSETFGILGRVYKDRWDAALKAGQSVLARGLLDKAIDAYLKGFQTDWRDAYPGINALTLMELREPPDPRRAEILPVVTYAVKRRIAAGKPDYWDHATLLELAVLGKDEAAAVNALAASLASVREIWEPETTARNLALIRKARTRRGESVAWLDQIETELQGSAKR